MIFDIRRGPCWLTPDCNLRMVSLAIMPQGASTEQDWLRRR